jgi:uncharacterized protein (TIGR00251 family)
MSLAGQLVDRPTLAGPSAEEKRTQAMKPKRHQDSPAETKTLISLRVQPKASKDRIVGETETGWKIALTAPPVDGKANKACLVFLAKLLHVPRSSIRVVRGETSRQKVVEVIGLSSTEVENRFRTQSAIENPERDQSPEND